MRDGGRETQKDLFPTSVVNPAHSRSLPTPGIELLLTDSRPSQRLELSESVLLSREGALKSEQVAPGVVRVAVAPFDAVNVYLIGDVLVDSGGRLRGKRLLSFLSGRDIRAHALTHGHFDHQGSSHYICESLAIPLWCGEGDRRAVESGNQADLFVNPCGFPAWLGQRLAGPSHPVSRSLKEGDVVGSFRVLEAPGHTPGHIAYWREADRILIIGDVLFHRDPVTLQRGLREPFTFATTDAAANRNSARRLAALNPAVICFGHGAPLRSGDQLGDFVSRLPD